MKPTPAKPRIIIAHVEGSGTADVKSANCGVKLLIMPEFSARSNAKKFDGSAGPMGLLMTICPAHAKLQPRVEEGKPKRKSSTENLLPSSDRVPKNEIGPDEIGSPRTSVNVAWMPPKFNEKLVRLAKPKEFPGPIASDNVSVPVIVLELKRVDAGSMTTLVAVSLKTAASAVSGMQFVSAKVPIKASLRSDTRSKGGAIAESW